MSANTRATASAPGFSAEIKACCAQVYASDWMRLLVGDCLHPGGLGLTERLADRLGLDAHSRVLDVAAGRGESAIHLAATTGCGVVGIDLSAVNTVEAGDRARAAGVGDRVGFVVGDAEAMDFDDATFDAVICECAFCTFPDKRRAALEFARVLRPGGRIGISDLTREGELPDDLSGLLAWVACIADAQPVHGYAEHLANAGLRVTSVEHHDGALRDLIETMRQRLVAANLLARIGRVGIEPFDVARARTLARAARDAVDGKKLGYAIICASKPAAAYD